MGLNITASTLNGSTGIPNRNNFHSGQEDPTHLSLHADDLYAPGDSPDPFLNFNPYRSGFSPNSNAGWAGDGGAMMLSPADRPSWYNRVAHAGYNEQETAAINRWDTNRGNTAAGDPENPYVHPMVDAFVHMGGQPLLEEAGLEGMSASMLGLSLLNAGSTMLGGASENAHMLGALRDYKAWRDQNPNATPEQINSYVKSHIGERGSSYTGLYNALSAGTLDMPDEERRAFMNHRPEIISTLLDQTYRDMGQMYPGGWSLPDESIKA